MGSPQVKQGFVFMYVQMSYVHMKVFVRKERYSLERTQGLSRLAGAWVCAASVHDFRRLNEDGKPYSQWSQEEHSIHLHAALASSPSVPQSS